MSTGVNLNSVGAVGRRNRIMYLVDYFSKRVADYKAKATSEGKPLVIPFEFVKKEAYLLLLEYGISRPLIDVYLLDCTIVLEARGLIKTQVEPDEAWLIL